MLGSQFSVRCLGEKKFYTAEIGWPQRIEGGGVGSGGGEFVGKLGGGGVVWEGCLRFLVRVG